MVSRCLSPSTTVSSEMISSVTSCHWRFICRWIQYSSEITRLMVLYLRIITVAKCHLEQRWKGSYTLVQPERLLVCYQNVVEIKYFPLIPFGIRLIWFLSTTSVLLLPAFSTHFTQFYQKQNIYKIGLLNGGQVLTFLEQNTLKTSVMCYVNPVDYWSILNRENDLTAR